MPPRAVQPGGSAERPERDEPEERDTDEEEGQPLTVILMVEGRPDIDRSQRHELPHWALGDDVKLLLQRLLREQELPDYGTDPSDWELFYDGFPWKGAWPLSEVPETPIYIFVRGLAPPASNDANPNRDAPLERGDVVHTYDGEPYVYDPAAYPRVGDEGD